MKKEEDVIATLERIIHYLEGQGRGKGDFGSATGFTVPHLNETEYLPDFQYPHPSTAGVMVTRRPKFSANNNKLRSALTELVDVGLFKKDPINGNTYVYYPTVPLSELLATVKRGDLPEKVALQPQETSTVRLTKETVALKTLGRILHYLKGPGFVKGEFGKSTGFTITNLNQTEYLQDFQEVRNYGEGAFVWTDQQRLAQNNAKLRAALSHLIEAELFKKENKGERTHLYFPSVSLSKLESIVKKGVLPNKTTLQPQGSPSVRLDRR